MEVLKVVAIVVAGLMVGCELAIAALIHPTLETLPESVHLPAASAIARVLGRFMPFWYGVVLLLTAASAWMEWRQSGVFPVCIATSAILWTLAIVYSITALVPINNRIASWQASAPPADWRSCRRRWDVLHRLRVLLLLVALALLAVGVVGL